MRRWLLVLALGCAPMMAQISNMKLLEQPKAPANPLGNTRFPAAKALQFKPQPVMPPVASPATLPIPKGQTDLNIVLDVVPQQCAHVRFVKPSPATDPHMVVGPPESFRGNMPGIQGLQACTPGGR